jgi:hypothetical protein
VSPKKFFAELKRRNVAIPVVAWLFFPDHG